MVVVGDAAVEPGESGAGDGDERGPAKNVDERQKHGLLDEPAVEGSEGSGLSGGRAHVAGEVLTDTADILLEQGIAEPDAVGEACLVIAGAADEVGLGDRDADGAADITQQIEDAGGVPDFLVGQRGGAEVTDGDKEEAGPESGKNNEEQKAVGAHLEIEEREGVGGETEQEEAKADEPAVVHFLRERTDHGEAGHGAESARGDDNAGGQGGVAEDLLQIERQQRDLNVHHESHAEDEKATDAEVAIAGDDVEADERSAVSP